MTRGLAEVLLTDVLAVTMDEERRVLAPGVIGIADGIIVHVGTAADPAPDAADAWSLPGRIVLPGFVNTHAHLVSALTRGLGNDRFQTGGDVQGKEISSVIRAALDEEASRAGARLALAELMMSGVTTTTDSQAARRGLEAVSDGTLQALTESGMRGVFFRSSVNRTDIIPTRHHDDPALAVTELDRLRRRWNSDRVTVGAEAMALHRVTRELIDVLAGWSRDNQAPFGMHLAYSEAAAGYSRTVYGIALLELLQDWNVLDERFLGYHPIWVTPSEIDVLATTGAGVGVCSAANMLIGARAAPIDALLTAGVRLGLGTDQPNDGHNFFEAMKSVVLHIRSSSGSTDFGSPELMLELATIGGARALHMDKEIGSIEVGKRADLVVIDGRRPSIHPLTGSLSNLVYAAGPSEVETVLVDGKPILVEGRPVAWDLEELVEGADRIVGSALRRAGIPLRPNTSWSIVGEGQSPQDPPNEGEERRARP